MKNIKGLPNGIIISTSDVSDLPRINDMITNTIFTELNRIARQRNKTNTTHKCHEKSENKAHCNDLQYKTCACNCSSNHSCHCANNKAEIIDVKFHKTTTVIFWSDGTKTIAICDPDDTYDPVAGFAIAVAKKQLGNQGFHDTLMKLAPTMDITKQSVKTVNSKSAEKTDTDVFKKPATRTKKVATKKTKQSSSKK